MKKILTVLMCLLVFSMVATGVFAMPQQNRQDMRGALGSGDYNGFQDALPDNRFGERLGDMGEERFGQVSERYQQRQGVRETIGNNDYAGFKEQIGGWDKIPQRFQDVDEEQFESFVEKYEEKQVNREEMKAAKEKIDAAIVAEDYSAFADIVASLDKVPPHFSAMTEEAFPTLVALHSAKESGDMETVQELKKQLGEELGLEKPEGREDGRQSGFGQGNGQGHPGGEYNGEDGQQRQRGLRGFFQKMMMQFRGMN